MEATKYLYKKTSPYIIASDYPDPDVIRVGNVFYMISTTMHFFPGAVILKSYNLADWEFASYVFTELDNTESQKLLNNKGIYGKGMWAASLRYHAKTFYVSFVANDTHKTYVYTSKSITGKWKKANISGFYHDMSLLFEDKGDGTTEVFCTHGNTNIYLTQLKSDLSGAKENGINKVIIQDKKEAVTLGYEGSHFYKINGKYYVFLINIPKNQMRTEHCFVADTIDGEYKGKKVLCCDVANWNSGAAQGGIVQNTDGNWYAVLFQDHGALGRIPVLAEVSFKDGFPVFKTEQTKLLCIAEAEQNIKEENICLPPVRIFDNNPRHKYKKLYSNNFTNPCWQFNHTPNKNARFTKNRFCITTDKLCKNVVQANNTFTTRTFGELCSASVFLDASKINNGDTAGFCALQGEYGFIGVTKKDGTFYLISAEHKSKHEPWKMGVFDEEEACITKKVLLTNTYAKNVQLKMEFDLTRNGQNVTFYYFNKDKNCFEQFGKAVKLRYTLDHFVGVRFALFCFSTIKTGGKATFTHFRFCEE